jgi:hypothetical protein
MTRTRESGIANEHEQGLIVDQAFVIEPNSITTNQMIQGESFLMSDGKTHNRTRHCKGVVVDDKATLSK